jgi:selenocysteine-specific elongation factor
VPPSDPSSPLIAPRSLDSVGAAGAATLILGTAGHVDHGKTSLVAALTGMDTDRLPEEKARGISIEIGVAWLDRSNGRIALVDVPGHERFVRQMVAGAVGMDGVLFVVAADEGVMPQTREHLDICRLLGIERGVIVLTRVDKAEPGLAELAAAEVRELVRGTFLADAELVSFSIHAPETRDAVVAAIDRMMASWTTGAPTDRVDRPFCMTVDRAFSRPGFGTIVTGTSASGTVSVGDELAIHVPGSAAQSARVRGLEHHGRSVDAIGPGRRVAINLVGPSVDEVPRGARLALRDSPLVSTAWLEVTIEARTELREAIRDGERGLAHFGATTLEASLQLRDGVPAGERRVGILRLAEPLLLCPGERWIFRGFRRDAVLGATLGGGVAWVPALGRRRFLAYDALVAPANLSDLGRWDGWRERTVGADATLVHAAVEARGEQGASVASLEGTLPLTRGSIRRALADLLARHAVSLVGQPGSDRPTARVGPDQVVADRPSARVDEVFVGGATLDHLGQAIVARLTAIHSDHPERPGVALDELRSRVRPDGLDGVFDAAVEGLVRRSRLVRVPRPPGSDARAVGMVRLAEFTPRLGDAELDRRLVLALDLADLAPPDPEALATALEVPLVEITRAINRLVPRALLTRVAGADRGLVFATTSLERFEARVRDHFAGDTWLDAQQLKTLAATTRKWAIPLGEWLDKRGVTVRVGDQRRLRRP